MTESIENKTFDEIQIGDAASVTRVLRPEDIETWAAVTGNLNLIDLDPTPVDSSMFTHGAGQASWAAALFAAIADTRLPGLGSVTVSADIHFLKPVPIGEEVTATVTVKGKRADEGIVVLDCVCRGSNGQELVVGTLEVEAAREKIATRCESCRRCSCGGRTAICSSSKCATDCRR